MLAVNIIAITGTVLGIGGIAGAIEHGTSPVAAVVCLVVGVACMKWSYKRSEDKMKTLTMKGNRLFLDDEEVKNLLRYKIVSPTTPKGSAELTITIAVKLNEDDS